MIYRPAIRGSRRGPHSVRFQQRTSIGKTSCGRAKCARSFYPGRGADGCRATAVGELSGELIFQRYQRQRRYLVASTVATTPVDDDEDDDGAIAVVRDDPRNSDHLAYPLLRRRPSRFLSRLLRRAIYCSCYLVGRHAV